MRDAAGTPERARIVSRRALLAAGAAIGSTLVAGCTSGGEATDSSSQDGDQTTDSGAGSDGGDGDSDDADAGESDESAMTTGSGAMTEANEGETATQTRESAGELPAWQTVELEDVLTGEAFTVGQFDTPVILETFAVWCPKCTSQQEKLTELKADSGDDVTIVSLNVDPNEDAEKVKQHASERGYDWRYAISPTELTSALVEEFGQVMTSAPSVPIVTVCPDGSAALMEQRGVKSIESIKDAVGNC
jgi:thiol-disulfide isomerase/thioredoxin